jgi:nitrogen fixation NifU-like protein
MSDLKELYQEVILDHSRKPRNFKTLGAGSRVAEGFNPLCGDKVTIYIDVVEDRIMDLSFQGSGCAISTASASLMTDALKGKSLAQAQMLFEQFHRLVTGAQSAPSQEIGHDNLLGKLTALGGVREFPMRVKCATLAWHTLRNALGEDPSVAVTE